MSLIFIYIILLHRPTLHTSGTTQMIVYNTLGQINQRFTPRTLTSLLRLGISRTPSDIETVSTTCWAWTKLRRYARSDYLYSPHIPLPDNPWLAPATKNLTKRTLEKFRLSTVRGLYESTRLRTVADMVARWIDLSYIEYGIHSWRCCPRGKRNLRT